MLDSLRLYPKFLGIAIRSRMQYRSDFLLGIIGVFILNFVNLALIWVLIARFQALAGWNFWEIVLLYATWLMSHSIYAVFFWHLSLLEEDILHGRFDQFLVRPCSPLIQFLGREVNYMGVGDVIFASTAFGLAYSNLSLDWSLGKWLFWLVALLAGLIIESCISWIFGAIAFWTGRSRAIFSVSLRFSILTQQYPIDIFGQWYRVFVTGFLPIAFINYYPLTILLDKPNALATPILGYLSPAVAAVVFMVAWFVWQRGLAGYTSSGN
jgi:ABC-2 type transport system permease protein